MQVYDDNKKTDIFITDARLSSVWCVAFGFVRVRKSTRQTQPTNTQTISLVTREKSCVQRSPYGGWCDVPNKLSVHGCLCQRRFATEVRLRQTFNRSRDPILDFSEIHYTTNTCPTPTKFRPSNPQLSHRQCLSHTMTPCPLAAISVPATEIYRNWGPMSSLDHQQGMNKLVIDVPGECMVTISSHD
jgi:hypothetical protein